MSTGSEPLGLVTRSISPPSEHPELRALHFTFSSRGDRVPGRLLLPANGEGPFPVVLLQHGAGGSKDAAYLVAAGGPWAQRGVAVAGIDFPLHGERADAKLSGVLLGGIARAGEPAASALGLAAEFARQALADLARALDALAELPMIDATRSVYAGFSLGAIIGAAFCAGDERPRAAALALAGAGLGPPGLDAAQHVGAIAPRPVLLVNATRDEMIPKSAADALFAAAHEPVEQLWFDGTHTRLPGDALKAMWLFLRRHLEVE